MSGEPAGDGLLPHLNAAGEARMVDVSDKAVTVRTATAAGRVRLSAECVAALRSGRARTDGLITHRFTPASKDVLLGWYPHTKLEMDEAARTQKRGKFGGVKYVYPKELMRELRGWFEGTIAERLPSCRVLYWT